MSTELMSRFLEGLHASRLLDTARIEELLRRPEPPQGDMDGVARFLEGNGWLTRYQINEIIEGRFQTLTFAGYRLLERLPDHPSGLAFRAFHPALQKSVVLRWLNRDWVDPADNLSAYLERAQTASLLVHAHAVSVLDAGITENRPFIVQELVDGAELGSLVSDMGALPVPLACEYIRQTAAALQAGSERGVFHGDLAPSHLILTPVVRKTGVNGSGQTISLRPAPGATVKVAELGLMPIRPPLTNISITDRALLGHYAFAAPERLFRTVWDAKADLWSLGASLYFLLAARPPFPANSVTEGLQLLQQAEPVRVDKLRNDVPAPLADLVHRMMARDPALRPANAAEVIQKLGPYCQFATAPMARPLVSSVPMASETGTIPTAKPVEELPLAEPLPHVEPLPEGTSDSQVFSPRSREPEPLHLDDDHHHDAFAHHAEAPLRPRKEVKSGKSWIILAILLHVIPISIGLLYVFDLPPFGRSVSSTTQEEKEKKPENTTGQQKKLNKPTKL